MKETIYEQSKLCVWKPVGCVHVDVSIRVDSLQQPMDWLVCKQVEDTEMFDLPIE